MGDFLTFRYVGGTMGHFIAMAVAAAVVTVTVILIFHPSARKKVADLAAALKLTFNKLP